MAKSDVSMGGFGLMPLGPSGIVMDTSKAMAILGFSPSQTFESTPMEDINKAFMRKLHVFLKNPKGYKNNKKKKMTEEQERKAFELQQMEIRRLNEALQYLIRKRTKTKALAEWQFGSKRGMAVSIALAALDEQTAMLRNVEFKEQLRQNEEKVKSDSMKAQNLAEEIVASIEGIDVDPPRTSRSNSFKRRQQQSKSKEVRRMSSGDNSIAHTIMSSYQVTNEDYKVSKEITKQRVFTPLPEKYHKRHNSARGPPSGKLRKSDNLTNSNPDLCDQDFDDTQSVIDIDNFDEMQSAFLQMNLDRVEEILSELNQHLDF